MRESPSTTSIPSPEKLAMLPLLPWNKGEPTLPLAAFDTIRLLKVTKTFDGSLDPGLLSSVLPKYLVARRTRHRRQESHPEQPNYSSAEEFPTNTEYGFRTFNIIFCKLCFKIIQRACLDSRRTPAVKESGCRPEKLRTLLLHRGGFMRTSPRHTILYMTRSKRFDKNSVSMNGNLSRRHRAADDSCKSNPAFQVSTPGR